MSTFTGIIDKINNYGNTIFETLLGKLQNLPGAFQGVATVVITFLAIIGLLTLLKKSIKTVVTIALVVLLIFIISIIFFK